MDSNEAVVTNVELCDVGAFSVTLTWEISGGGPLPEVRVRYRKGIETFKTHRQRRHVKNECTILNLEPCTSYEVRVMQNIEGRWTVVGEHVFETAEESSAGWQDLYESLRCPDGSYNAGELSDVMHEKFVDNFNSFGKTGDQLTTPVKVFRAPNSKLVRVTAVVDGDEIDVVQNTTGIFLPFSRGGPTEQGVVLTKGSARVPVAYDRDSNAIRVQEKWYSVDDTFDIHGMPVTVAAGSIVLVFQDRLLATYPHSLSSAQSITTTSGSVFAKAVSCAAVSMVAAKNPGTSATSSISSYAYDTSIQTTLETTRVSGSVDAAKQEGTISLGVLHTDGDVQFMNPVVESTSDKTIVTAQSADATTKTTIDFSGISFDNDDSAVYFGRTKEFRIKYSFGTPSMLKIESYDTVTESYATRLEFTNGA